MSRIKITNNTKDAKGVLEQYCLVNVSLECCGQLVEPGASIEVQSEDWSPRSYAHLIELGAIGFAPVAESQDAKSIFEPSELKASSKKKEAGPALVFTDEKKKSE